MVRKRIGMAAKQISKKSIDNKRFFLSTVVFVILFLAALVVYSMFTNSQNGNSGFASTIRTGLQDLGNIGQGQQVITTPLNKRCNTDSDCVLYDQSSDCGCYSKDALPTPTGEDCTSLLPASCACLDGACYGVFSFGTG